MNNHEYDPVEHDHDAFMSRAARKKGFQEEYEALRDEYALVNVMLTARKRAGMTQEAVAQRMGTSKSVVSRLESGRQTNKPSLKTLERYADAVGCTLHIEFVPTRSRTRGQRRR